MTRYGMVVDPATCNACYGCFAACKDEHWDNDFKYSAGQPRFGQFWINLRKRERGTYPYVQVTYMPDLCQHCGDAPCEKVAENGAVKRTETGQVIFDPEKAVGQRAIMDACPYGIAYWNEEKQIAQKCTMCAHRLEEGKQPRCVQFCPSGSLKFGDLDDPSSEVAKLVASGVAKERSPEMNTKPSVYYMNLERMQSEFIAGSVVLGDVDECAVGATVTMTGAAAGETTANMFGEFQFDGLKAGKYTVKVEAPGYAPQSLEVDLRTTHYLGAIVLQKLQGVDLAGRSSRLAASLAEE